jgi:formylglycine-generating enzyme required for sulfatase activity
MINLRLLREASHVLRLVLVTQVLAVAGAAWAGSIGSPSGCRVLKGAERGACERCIAGGNFYQPGSGCGATSGMRASKAVAQEKAPPRPATMPKTGKLYVTVPAGSFSIGARENDPDKDDGKEVFGATVTLSHTFEMKATEVTQAEYLFIMGEVTSAYDKQCGLDCAAGGVSWEAAVRYLNELSKKEKLEPCYELKDGRVRWPKGYECTGYRLPTEAEWEYAARAGTEEPRYGELDAIAWHHGNSEGIVRPAGTKQKNAFGLHDMLGNVWEWTWDRWEYKPYAGEMTDPVIGGLELEALGEERCLRGGSAAERDYIVRVQHRFQGIATDGGAYYGFRPVRTVKKP